MKSAAATVVSLALAVIVMVPALPARAQITLVAHASGSSGAVSGVNGTGANAIVVCSGVAGSLPSDSSSNTYVQCGERPFPGQTPAVAYCSFGATVSSNMTFNNSGNAMTAILLSGVASGPDQVYATNSQTNYPLTTTVTPTNANEAAINCGVNQQSSGSPTVTTTGMTQLDTAFGNPFGYLGVFDAYTIQSGGPTAINTTTNCSVNCGAPAVVTLSLFSRLSPATFATNTTSLLEGSVGTAYSAQLAAIGGLAPYTWTITSGTLSACPGLTLSSSGLLSGTPTGTCAEPLVFRATDSTTPTGQTASTPTITLTVAASALTLGAGTCTGSVLNVKQLTAFSGCTLAASGGTTPYTYSYYTTDTNYQTPPEGIALNASTGALTSSRINGQGGYLTQFIVTDAIGTTATQNVLWAAAGDNTFGGVSLNPAGSVWSARVDGLPIDTTTPFHTIDTNYSSQPLRALFGPDPGGDGGIPINTVPSTQPFVAITGGVSFNITSGPIPCDAAIESGYNAIPGNGDNHVAVFIRAGAQPAALYTLYYMLPQTNCTWQPSPSVPGSGSAVVYAPSSPPNIGSFAMLASDGGVSENAAGTPTAAGLINYDEVAGGCGIGAECGAIKHAINMTLNNVNIDHLWPATGTAGGGGCSGGYSDGNRLITQSAGLGQGLPNAPGTGTGPPTNCGTPPIANPLGQTFIIPNSVSEPSQCSSNNVTHIIFIALQRYGLRLTDIGGTGYIEGTPDSRWPSVATLNACLNQITLGQLVSPIVDSLAIPAQWPNSSQVNSSAVPSVGVTGAAVAAGAVEFQ